MTARPDAWPMQLDFAQVAGQCFVAYGWIAGLGSHVARARLQADGWHCSLLSDALLVSRADVSAHLGAAHPAMAPLHGEEARHEHGFFILVDWEGEAGPTISKNATLRLTMQTQSGVTQQREWPIAHGATLAAETLRHHERAMRLLIGRQSPRQVRLLTELFDPPLVLRSGDLHGVAANDGPAFQVPIACIVGDKLMLAGLSPTPLRQVHTMVVRWYLHHGDQPRAVEADVLALVRELPDAPSWPAADGDPSPPDPRAFVVSVPLPDDATAAGTEIELVHQGPAGAGKRRLMLRSHPQDVQRRLATWLGGLGANNRVVACESILDALATDPQAGQPANHVAWQDNLTGHMEACLGGLPTSVEHRTGTDQVSFFLEHAVLVPGAGVMLAGWAYADSAKALAVSFHVGGQTHAVSARWVRRPRADVQKHLVDQGLGQVDEPGFVCLVDMPDCAAPLRPAYLKVALGDHAWRIRLPALQSAEPARRLIRTLLATVDPQCSELRRLMDDHVGRAVQTTWGRRPPPRGTPQVWQFGPRPSKPAVSIVVPLFGRNDLADYQLAMFANDPDLHAAEIIYVMDDPSVLHEFRQRCTDLHRMHGLAFTLAYPGDNLGFAGASNHGAALAHAPLLLLLNSDVFPRKPGWLTHMAGTFARHPDTGTLGVKLLYEDGSVQHAGMDSVPLEDWGGMWINRHPHKGLHAEGLVGVHAVPAVTAACVMLETAFFRSLGGLSEDYIIGDFEDSDLCYRARIQGRPARIDLDVSLYHLERQSQDLGDPRWRTALTLYNCWIHDRRWGQALRKAAAA